MSRTNHGQTHNLGNYDADAAAAAGIKKCVVRRREKCFLTIPVRVGVRDISFSDEGKLRNEVAIV